MNRLLVFAVMVCFAIMPVQVFAQSPFNEINEKLDNIQETVDSLVECPSCPIPCPGCEDIGVPKTGQTTVYERGDDGHLQMGIYWPTPRFTINPDEGTVDDNFTGLKWMRNAGCEAAKSWFDALTFCNDMASEQCGLSDGSIAGDWRLANLNELMSLQHLGFHAPAVPNTEGSRQASEGDPFNNLYSSWYWSSTTYVWVITQAWRVPLSSGGMMNYDKTVKSHVLCVRDGP